MTTIPASELVNVIPSVLPAGGTAVDTIGLLLTTSTRPPTGAVLSFGGATAVQNYFGGSSGEFAFAQDYFPGFDGSDVKPSALLVAQLNLTAVSGYLRGGNVSGLTLAQLQAISGSLDVVVDGYPRNASSVNLSGAGSFSIAAGTIQTALNAADPTEASITASIGATFTGSGSGTNLTTSATVGLISIGDTVAGTGISANTTILSQTSGTPGGNGVYVTSQSSTASGSCTASSNVLDVTVVGSGTVAPGQSLTGAGVTEVVITGQLTGTTGGVGTYSLAGTAQQVASESMTAVGTPVAVTYDSQSGAFVISSGITGAGSTAAFATGSIAASLALTSATGAVLSQGRAAVTSSTFAAFMNALVAVNSNWATFTTLSDPDNSGFAFKEAIAAWKNTQNARFAYVAWDLDQSPTTQLPATSSFGYALANNGDSGTCLLAGETSAGWSSTTAPLLAAFVMGAAASIDFEEKDGRITFAYKSQAGFTATVVDQSAGDNLAGNPQAVPAARGNGYNFYGAYAQGNSSNVWFQRGFVTGSFLWLDSYINQIWLNSSFQAAFLAALGTAKSVPYNAAGNAFWREVAAAPIAAGRSFGAFAPGTIDAAQAAEVNGNAGANIANTLQAQGYYLQILNADAATRAARASPPMKFFYLDRGSVQAITLSSIAVQ